MLKFFYSFILLINGRKEKKKLYKIYIAFINMSNFYEILNFYILVPKLFEILYVTASAFNFDALVRKDFENLRIFCFSVKF